MMELFKRFFTKTPKKNQDVIVEGLEELSTLEEELINSKVSVVSMYFAFGCAPFPDHKSITIKWDNSSTKGEIEVKGKTIKEICDKVRDHLK